MLRDITPYLMGDPCTAYRRQPTQAEIERGGCNKWDRHYKPVNWTGCFPRQSSFVRQMKVNEVVYRNTRSAARYACIQMDMLGMRGRYQRVGERYIVERLA